MYHFLFSMFIHFLVCTCFSFCCSCFGNRFIVVHSSVLLIFSMLFFPTICYVTIFSSKEEYEFLPHFACILELAQFKIGICNPPFSDEITQLYIKAHFFFLFSFFTSSICCCYCCYPSLCLTYLADLTFSATTTLMNWSLQLFHVNHCQHGLKMFSF